MREGLSSHERDGVWKASSDDLGRCDKGCAEKHVGTEQRQCSGIYIYIYSQCRYGEVIG